MDNSLLVDQSELAQNLFTPGPTSNDPSDTGFDLGRLRYFDNRPTDETSAVNFNLAYVDGTPLRLLRALYHRLPDS